MLQGGLRAERGMGVPKLKWTSAEEEALRAGIAKYGIGKWINIKVDPEFSQILISRSNIDLKVLSFTCPLILYVCIFMCVYLLMSVNLCLFVLINSCFCGLSLYNRDFVFCFSVCYLICVLHLILSRLMIL